MDWFLYDNGLRHERFKEVVDRMLSYHRPHLLLEALEIQSF